MQSPKEMKTFSCRTHRGCNEIWTESNVRKLIEIYKQYPCLWDNKTRGYRIRSMRNEALKKISVQMGMDSIEVERKINVLLTQYRRTYRKVKERNLGPEEIENHIWYGFKLLEFLEDRYNSSFIEAQKEKSNEDPQAPQQEDPEDEDVSDYESYPNAKTNPNPLLARKRKLLHAQKHNNLIRMVEGQVNKTLLGVLKDMINKKGDNKDEYDLYGEQIVMKLRRYDERLRAETQHQINCILHEADMKMIKDQPRFYTIVQTPSTSSRLSPADLITEGDIKVEDMSL